MPNYARIMAGNEAGYMGMPGFIAYKSNGKNKQFVDQFAEEFSKWMAYNELANDPRYQGKKELSAEERNRIDKNAAALAENIRSSQGFQEMFKPEYVEGTIEMICGKKETWEHINPWPLDYDTVRESFLGRLKRFDEQREQKRAEVKGIVERLKETSSKTITGKLKSFFVGNSKEYDTAFKAMQDLSNGKTTPEQAKDAIKNYLDIRKNKVRNHEYGRDRFKLMMQGLQSVMEPQEFADYCKGVDKDRADRSKGNYRGETHPEDYYPTRSGKKNLEEMMEDAGKKQPTRRDAARMAAVYRLVLDDPDRVLDPAVIRREADNLEKNPTFDKWFRAQTPEGLKKMMSSEKGMNEVGHFEQEVQKAERRAQQLKQQQEQEKARAEKNQKYLDTLRKNGKNFSEQDLKDYADYVGRHPEVRGDVEKIIKEQGLNMKLPEPPKKEQGKGGPDKNVQDKGGQDKGNQGKDGPEL